MRARHEVNLVLHLQRAVIGFKRLLKCNFFYFLSVSPFSLDFNNCYKLKVVFITGPEKQAIDGRDMEIDKQNASVGQQQPNISAREADIRRLSKLLQDAGLDEAYVESPPPVMGRQGAPPQPRARPQSEGSETPLGSLDRTKVSLGDTESTTDSRKFIR